MNSRHDKTAAGTRVAAVILAAGQGRRFGGPDATKVVAHLRGVPLVRRVALSALSCRAVSVTVVSGHAHESVANALQGLQLAVVHNPDFASGLSSSLKVGLATLPDDIDGVLVLLADMPLVTSRTLDKIIARFDDRPDMVDAVVPAFEGRRGNPVLIGRRLFASVGALHGDEGARRLLSSPDLLVDLCEVDDPGVTIDVDTLASLSGL